MNERDRSEQKGPRVWTAEDLDPIKVPTPEETAELLNNYQEMVARISYAHHVEVGSPNALVRSLAGQDRNNLTNMAGEQAKTLITYGQERLVQEITSTVLGDMDTIYWPVEPQSKV